MLPLLYIIIPCFNVSAVLPFSVKFYEQKAVELATCEKISAMSRILLVDNGSSDGTWETILKIADKNPLVEGVKLGHYCGTNNAVFCGIKEANKYCDIALVADSLCRKDINAVDRMIEEYNKGYETVFGAGSCRISRKPGSINHIIPQKTTRDYGFFLISKPVLNELCRYNDREMDIKTIINDMNFKNACVYYGKRNTFNHKDKLNFERIREKFLSFFNSFAFPVHIMLIVGGVLSVYLLFHLILLLFINFLGYKQNVFATIILLSLSVNLLSIGIIGEYIIKLTAETKNHPSYTIVETTKQANE